MTSFFRDVRSVSRPEVDKLLSAHGVIMLPVHGGLPLILQRRGANVMLIDPQGATWEMPPAGKLEFSASVPDFVLEGELLSDRFYAREIVQWGTIEAPVSSDLAAYIELIGTARALMQGIGEHVILHTPIMRNSDKQQIFLQQLATPDWAGARFLAEGAWLEHTIQRQLLVRVLQSKGGLHWCVYQEDNARGPAFDGFTATPHDRSAAIAFTTQSAAPLNGLTLEIGYESAELAPYPILNRAVVHGSSASPLPDGQQLFWRPRGSELVRRPSTLEVEKIDLDGPGQSGA